MGQRFDIVLLAAIVAAATALAVPAGGQAPDATPPLQGPETAPSAPGPEITPPTGEPLKPIEPPANLPRAQHGDRTINLDRLFQALKIAPDDESAKYIENRIWSLWMSSGGDTANLLMTRVKMAVDSKDLDLAIRLLTAIIDIRPDFVEAWNRRATLHYQNKDFARSLTDIREVLSREPRHFGALSGLGMILQELGDDRHALDAFRRALAVHPHLERIPDLVKKLTEKVEGRDI
jgi:tetratricopeptide (TPR) repeat protein